MSAALRTTLIAGLILGLTLPVFAAERPGAAWLETGPGGRAAALGEAMTASVRGATATYWNPAAVGLGGNAIEVMHADWWMEGGATQYLTGVFQSGRFGFGVSALHFGVEDLELRSRPSTSPVGTFEARSYAFGGTAAMNTAYGFRIGATLRVLNEKIYVDDAYGWSLDLGLLRTDLLDGHLDVGATVRHLGEMEALREEAYELPTTVSAGVSYRFDPVSFVQPTLMLDGAWVRDLDPLYHGGLELTLFDHLALRGGYTSGIETRGISGGFGLLWQGWRFDYGYTPYTEELGDAQRFSVAYHW